MQLINNYIAMSHYYYTFHLYSQSFKDNFFRDFYLALDAADQTTVVDLDECDFYGIYKHSTAAAAAAAQRQKRRAKKLKAEKAATRKTTAAAAKKQLQLAQNGGDDDVDDVVADDDVGGGGLSGGDAMPREETVGHVLVQTSEVGRAFVEM
jgi:membrane protein involved in colicin uptake